jgi:hypothetical protein
LVGISGGFALAGVPLFSQLAPCLRYLQETRFIAGIRGLSGQRHGYLGVQSIFVGGRHAQPRKFIFVSCLERGLFPKFRCHVRESKPNKASPSGVFPPLKG